MATAITFFLPLKSMIVCFNTRLAKDKAFSLRHDSQVQLAFPWDSEFQRKNHVALGGNMKGV